ncbi:MAG: RNA methyltransferase [Alicyclobacillus sp.]|nr:RNA methyltransferase [Alicyclobacillus sp.]
MYIESPQNPRIRAWARLKTKRGREEQGLFLAEGVRLVRELLRSALVTQAVLRDASSGELPDDIADAAAERGVPVIDLSPQAFAAVSDTSTPQGVLAIAQIPGQGRGASDRAADEDGRMGGARQADGIGEAGRQDAEAVGASASARRAVLLDGIQDPGNVGTLLRTADAFGIGEVCCATGTADPFSPKVVRASMGGVFRVPVRTMDGAAYVRAWRSRWPGGTVALADARAEHEAHRTDWTGAVLLLIGSEAQGVSDAVASLATLRVRIPMTRHADSLNAAVAGSILMYEVFRHEWGEPEDG